MVAETWEFRRVRAPKIGGYVGVVTSSKSVNLGPFLTAYGRFRYFSSFCVPVFIIFFFFIDFFKVEGRTSPSQTICEGKQTRHAIHRFSASTACESNNVQEYLIIQCIFFHHLGSLLWQISYIIQIMNVYDCNGKNIFMSWTMESSIQRGVSLVEWIFPSFKEW